MYICYILPVPANDIAIENIFFYTFWFKYSTSIYNINIFLISVTISSLREMCFTVLSDINA